MAKKSVVILSPAGEKVPFLRGILVQSMVEAGLDFGQAYAAAQSVRDALAERPPLNPRQLRTLVAEVLERQYGAPARLAYESGHGTVPEILVRTPSRTAPFSVGILTRYLEGCAIEREQALAGARTVHEMLQARKLQEIDSKELRRAVYQTLNRDCCAEAAARFLSRYRFEASRQPLIVLLGGPPGSGKSTVSSALAYRLGIAHTQSTDMMREIIRCYLAPKVVPTLGYSSFEAWRGLPTTEKRSGAQPGTDNPVIAGFLSQAAAVRIAVEASIARALKEHQDIIIEGVHLMPWQMDLKKIAQHAVVVPVMLAVTTSDQLGGPLQRRGREQPNRRSRRYRENLQAIWDIQTFMLDQAEKHTTSVIVNWHPDETARALLVQVMTQIGERFPPDPATLGLSPKDP